MYPPHTARVLSRKEKPAQALGPVWVRGWESLGSCGPARGDWDVTGQTHGGPSLTCPSGLPYSPRAQGWERGRTLRCCLHGHTGDAEARAALGESGQPCLPTCRTGCPPSSLVSCVGFFPGDFPPVLVPSRHSSFHPYGGSSVSQTQTCAESPSACQRRPAPVCQPPASSPQSGTSTTRPQ